MLETHRVIVTMWKMDTQECNHFGYTKKINAQMFYACSKCCDTRFQVTDPERLSFQYPRSNNHILEIAGYATEGVDIPISEFDVCYEFDDWAEKGYGYFPRDIAQILDEIITVDPHYGMTTDIYHGAKNIFLQYFASVPRICHIHRDKTFFIFQHIVDFWKLNHIESKFDIEGNWKADRSDTQFVKEISLEIAPYALV